MNLLEAVESGCLKKVQAAIESDGIVTDHTWTDYEALLFALINQCRDIAVFLLAKSCRVNKTTDPEVLHDTPLHLAIKAKDKELVEKLLEKRASVKAFNSCANTPLHLAFLLKHVELVDVMLDHLVKTSNYANPKNKYGLSHMHIACTRKNTEVVHRFLCAGIEYEESVNEDSPLWAHYNSLHFAVEFKSLEAIRTIVNGIEDSFCDHEEIWGRENDELIPTPLAMAKKGLKNYSIIMDLLSNKNNDKRHDTLTKLSNFHVACMQGDVELVKRFIRNGTKVNSAIDKNDAALPLYTPLHLAAENHHKEIVKLLLKSGAELECQNAYNMTPLHLAVYNHNYTVKNATIDLLYKLTKYKEKNLTDINRLNYFHVAITRNDIPTVKKFLSKGVDTNEKILRNCRNFSMYTPLHIAVQYQLVEMTELLIKNGADVHQNSRLGTPLHLAFDAGHKILIELLLKHGAKMDSSRSYDGQTMLHSLVAAYSAQLYYKDALIRCRGRCLDPIGNPDELLEYIEKFLVLGIDVNVKDDDGNTPLHLVCDKLNGGLLAAKILFEFGADINVENNLGETPFDTCFGESARNWGKESKILYNHVHCLKAMGLKVNPKNEIRCGKILVQVRKFMDINANCFEEELLQHEERLRLEEVKKLKTVQLDSNMTLYHFLKLDKEQLDSFVMNQTLKTIVESKDLEAKYPSYAFLIRLQYNKRLNTFYSSTLNAEKNIGRRNSAKQRRIY